MFFAPMGGIRMGDFPILLMVFVPVVRYVPEPALYSKSRLGSELHTTDARFQVYGWSISDIHERNLEIRTIYIDAQIASVTFP